jgi:hypothetical protein
VPTADIDPGAISSGSTGRTQPGTFVVLPMTTMFERTGTIFATASSAADPQRAALVGLECDSHSDPCRESGRRGRRRVSSPEWPWIGHLELE